MNEIEQSFDSQYAEFENELAICQIGGLFLALYKSENVPDFIISRLQKDLPEYFQFPLKMTEKKVWFPIFFEQSFEQMGKQSNIFHVLGIEALSEKAQDDFIQYLQYGRERFKALPYSIVFWVHPPFAKQLFHAAPDFYHWIFGTYDFSQITPQQESTSQQDFLANIDQYLEKLIWQYEHWQEVKDSGEDFLLEVMSRANLHDDYVKLYCTDKDGETILLDTLLDEFLANKKQSFMTLLGDFGTGKSSFSLHDFIIQAKLYLMDKSQRIPLFISLKDYQGKLDLETFITKEFYNKFGLPVSLVAFQNLALQGQFLFFIDGFDEMVSMSNKQETIENFKELTKLSFENLQFMTLAEDESKTNKVFMTCRTHYFFTDTQEQNILRADKTVLYRNYATKTHYQVARINLKELNQEQIGEYVLKSIGDKEAATQLLNIIKDTYNLEELSSRPLLLDMIVKTVPELKDKEQINAIDLYREYTNIWIERDDWRSQMTPEGKREFMWELAIKMYQKGGDFSLHYSNLNKPKEKFFKQKLDDSDDYYKYETTTCSFLHRDRSGNYKFIHKSFMEYFIAEYFFNCIKTDKKSLLQYSETNKEIKFFLKMIVSINKRELCHLNLSNLILYKIDLTEANLEGANLEGADLDEAHLKGANLKGANLEKTELRGAYLKGANLERANLKGTKLIRANIEGVNFAKANFERVVSLLIGINFERANLEGANFKEANLPYENFKEANLKDACLLRANFTKANFESANLERVSLEGANLEKANLEKANLEGANLEGANLEGANLKAAYLKGVQLGVAQLEKAKLKGADLKNADLFKADFEGADLEDACLIRANCEEVNFKKANILGTDFSGAKLKNAKFDEGAKIEKF
jgi:uncharacterized protein YjbI with pentapeptide repeats